MLFLIKIGMDFIVLAKNEKLLVYFEPNKDNTMKISTYILILCMSLSIGCSANKEVQPNVQRSWAFTRSGKNNVRGGTSIGTKVDYLATPPKSWHELQNSEPTPYKKDRKAIYALAGEYEVKFEFIETFKINGFEELDQPYFSWGTEFVKVVEDTGDFISLQHIMVMEYKNPKTGKIEGPFVMKHWRQDWVWQGQELLEYQGNSTWELKTLNEAESIGKWTWHVYQVDDSPRYAGTGIWDHQKSFSKFQTDTMLRPLPRRERSVRKDYKILLGIDTLIVTPLAWYHEQKSFKQKEAINEIKGIQDATMLSREIGHNRYRRIQNFPFTKGHKYWETTKDYWSDVRFIWKDIVKKKKRFKLKGLHEKMPLFSYHFTQAGDEKILNASQIDRRKTIRKTIENFLVED